VREVNLEVAGYPNANGMTLKMEGRHGASWSIVPPVDPANNWQTIWVRSDPKSPTFKIVAKDQSGGAWFAFTMPTVSTGGAPGRWARALAASFFYFIDAGVVLLVLGAIGSLADAEFPSVVKD
jgi:hypothetical protein